MMGFRIHSRHIPIIVLLVAFSSVGCSSASESQSLSEPMATSKAASAASAQEFADRSASVNGAQAAPQLANRPSAATVPITPTRQVIRRAELVVRVPNVESAEREVNRLVQKEGGYIESTTSTDLASDHPSLTLAVRVPAPRFDEVIGAFEKTGVRLSKSTSSEDVTGQLVDLDARLATMRAQEETYRGLLRRAQGLDSVMTLQDKLSQVRAEIESMAGQRKVLGGLAALSSISLRLEQDAVAHGVRQDPHWMAQAWGESTTKFSGVLRFATSIALDAAVFSPFWVPVLVLAMRLWRRRTAVSKTPGLA